MLRGRKPTTVFLFISLICFVISKVLLIIRITNSLALPMEIVFKNGAQRRRYEILAQKEVVLSIYPNGPTMTTLGIRDSVMYLLNQLGWDTFAVRKRFSTYRVLTLEFLSSLSYNPNHGL